MQVRVGGEVSGPCTGGSWGEVWGGALGARVQHLWLLPLACYTEGAGGLKSLPTVLSAFRVPSHFFKRMCRCEREHGVTGRGRSRGTICMICSVKREAGAMTRDAGSVFPAEPVKGILPSPLSEQISQLVARPPQMRSESALGHSAVQ